MIKKEDFLILKSFHTEIHVNGLKKDSQDNHIFFMTNDQALAEKFESAPIEETLAELNLASKKGETLVLIDKNMHAEIRKKSSQSKRMENRLNKPSMHAIFFKPKKI